MPDKFPQNISNLRKNNGDTQEALARKLANFWDDPSDGKTRISKIENGHAKRPDIDLLIAISKIYNTPLDVILKGEIILNDNETVKFFIDNLKIVFPIFTSSDAVDNTIFVSLYNSHCSLFESFKYIYSSTNTVEFEKDFLKKINKLYRSYWELYDETDDTQLELIIEANIASLSCLLKVVLSTIYKNNVKTAIGPKDILNLFEIEGISFKEYYSEVSFDLYYAWDDLKDDYQWRDLAYYYSALTVCCGIPIIVDDDDPDSEIIMNNTTGANMLVLFMLLENKYAEDLLSLLKEYLSKRHFM